MGMDLYRPSTKESMRLSHAGWAQLLVIADANGWEGNGTVFDAEHPNPGYPDYMISGGWEGWDGNYSSNDGQWVLAEDAANMADALERVDGGYDRYGGVIDFLRGGDFCIW